MKSLRSLQGRVRTLLSRTEHSGAQASVSESSIASTSGRSVENSAAKPTPVFRQFRGQSARYGPHAPYRFPWPWKEGVLLLSGGAIGWVACRNSTANFDLLIDFPTMKDYFRESQGWPISFSLGSGSPLRPNFMADAAARAVPAVVSINVRIPGGSNGGSTEKTCGSGFITDPSGIILTNAHVVEDAIGEQRASGKQRNAHLRIALQDGRSFVGTILSIDKLSDLALVKVEAAEALPTVRMGSSGGMRVGDWVLALGSPLTLQNSVTAGIVSCTGRKAKELGLQGSGADFIQTDAAINTGNSGGPLVNMAGEVVGISCMRALNSNGVSFAIPIDTARGIMEQLLHQGRVLRPYVGIQMLQLNAQNAAQMQKRDSHFPALTTGILVPSVHAGSPAAKAGLRQGDIITGFGGPAASGELSISHLVDALAGNIGRPLLLDVRRGQEQLKLSITACEAPNA